MSSPFDDPAVTREQQRRSLEPYLKFVRNMDPERSLDTRLSHIVYDVFEDRIDWLVDALHDVDVSVGLSVPARPVEMDSHVRDGVRRLVEAGAEVLVHGYRHTSYMDTPYETADRELATVIHRFDEYLDVRPTGFHVPFMRCSRGTVRAAEAHGIEWLVGIEPPEESSSLTFVHPAVPYDIHLFEQGYSGAVVVDRLEQNAEEESLLLCHPNVFAFHDATDDFTAWLAERTLAAPSAAAAGTSNRPGLVLDCFPPFQLD